MKLLNYFSLLFALPVMADLKLTQKENDQIESMLKWIYSNQEVIVDNPMNTATLKVSKDTGEVLEESEINPKLKLLRDESDNSLLKQAQKKATDSFNHSYCLQVLKKKFPELNCDVPQGKQKAKKHDDVKLLTASWTEPTYALEDIPSSATTKTAVWSDDYWRIQWGATSYRYAEGQDFEDYQSAVGSYSQPLDWKKLMKSSGAKIGTTIEKWAPSEKYDLTVGDSAFSLTNAQKQEGKALIGEDGNVEPWMGICHGWAAAAVIVERPMVSVIAKGLKALGKAINVKWYPHDIRAMASLAWANGRSDSNFVGGRCNVKDPKTFKNGRLIQDECFDNASNTYHLALGNMIGRAGKSFVMDKTFDYQVWNQPIYSYEFVYFNPLKPEVRTQNWKKDWKRVAVDYDKFKPHDRFQKPLTRGECTKAGNCDDSKIKKIVGVIASVVYIAEVFPIAEDTPAGERLVRETYTYDLELESRGAKWIATGGEWHYNSHPDFLWVPTKNALAHTAFDKHGVGVDLSEQPTEALTQASIGASQRSYPLCGVVSELVAKSSGTKPVKCAHPTR